MKWLDELTACPKRVEQCSGPNWGNISSANPEHPGGFFEVRSSPTAGNHANQCVYDKDGNIMTSIPAAGTADYARHSYTNTGHLNHDVRPWWLAKKLNRKADYYSVRPIITE